MTAKRAYISGMGIVSPLGIGVSETLASLTTGHRGIGPLTLFPTPSDKHFPVGQVPCPDENSPLPRTHRLARMAADEAMAGSGKPLDAVIIGTTTGGMLTTETLLKKRRREPPPNHPKVAAENAGNYRYHAAGSVAEDLAHRYAGSGPVISVSTACSSGTTALKIALEMVRSGRAGRMLVGAADSLCRLTYYGFCSLQLIDPQGACPLDADRRGMSVAEGAAMFLITTERENALAEIRGAGLSCDAYHPTSPDPRGRGAAAAMRAAVADAGISIEDIEYINLHGTGTRDNDLSEARGLKLVFPGEKPPISSVKGATGHSLAAAGALEACIAVLAITHRILPANTGCRHPDPHLGLDPLPTPVRRSISTVLSNSFGFGGNNAAVAISTPGRRPPPGPSGKRDRPMTVMGYACFTGAGDAQKTLSTLSRGAACAGALPLEEVSKNLSPGRVRRLKRLPRMALSLAHAALIDPETDLPETESALTAVFLGTGWGALSETHDFLSRLYDTHEQFPSPTDFIGSVHNAPGGQIAMAFRATGPNITTTGGDYSFEQALLSADLISAGMSGPFLVAGADEAHVVLSPLLDRSVAEASLLADGGGALCLQRESGLSRPIIRMLSFGSGFSHTASVSSLVRGVTPMENINRRFGAILAGIPKAFTAKARRQLAAFLKRTRFTGPVIDYRRITGEFASASAVAAVLAVIFVRRGTIPGALCGGRDVSLNGRGVLIIGLGDFVTAMAVDWP